MNKETTNWDLHGRETATAPPVFVFFRGKLRSLITDEDGQSLIFGILSVFIVLFFGATVLGVGRVTSRRVQMQHAADSAAYAAVAKESESLNLIAAINTAMARTRGRSMEYIADVYMYGVLNEIRQRIVQSHGELQESEAERDRLLEQLADNGDLSTSERESIEEEIERIEERIAVLEEAYDGWEFGVDPGVPDSWHIIDKVGIDRADLEFEAASERAATWIGAAGGWIEHLSRLQHTTAILAPQLASEAVYEVATKQGARYASVFPSSRWFPRDDQYLAVHARRWPGDRRWRIEGGGEAIEINEIRRSEAINLASRPGFCAEFHRAWVIEWQRGIDSSRHLVVELEPIDEGEPPQWYWEDLYTGESRCIRQTAEYRVITWGPDNIDVVYYEEGFRALINTDGNWPRNTMFVRRGEGFLEIANPPPDADPDWEPREGDFSTLPGTEVEVDGVDVALTMDPVIPLPGRARIRVLNPWHIDLTNAAGERWARVHLREERTYLTATINRVRIRVRDGRAGFRRRGEKLWTHQEDGRWHAHFHIDERYWWQHRLSPVERDRWLYEYEEEGGRLTRETNTVRLAAQHATRGTAPDGGWSDPDTLPVWAYESRRLPGGWLDLDSAAPVDADDGDNYIYEAPSGSTYEVTLHSLPEEPQDGDDPEQPIRLKRYHQVRECWEPGCDDGMLPPRDPLDPDSEPEPCPTCEARGYVIVDAGEVELPEVDLSFLARDEFRPLVLDEEFVKHGVTVGVWSPADSHFRASSPGGGPDRPVEYLLHDPQAGMRGLLRGDGATPRQRGERVRPEWGHFAVAAARPRLMAGPANPAEPGRMQYGWYFSEDAVNFGDREDWLGESMWNLYLVDSGGRWSHWDAALVPFNMQLLATDIREMDGIWAESGTGWLMQRIAYGSPGGVARTLHTDVPGWWRYQSWRRFYGHVSGWAKDIYGGYDDDYPPGTVRDLLLRRIRPRQPYPDGRPPYIDPYDGTLRDPLMEHLAEEDRPGRGRQLDWQRLDDWHIQH